MSGSWPHDLPETMLVLAAPDRVLASRWALSLKPCVCQAHGDIARVAAIVGVSSDALGAHAAGTKLPRTLRTAVAEAAWCGVDALEMAGGLTPAAGRGPWGEWAARDVADSIRRAGACAYGRTLARAMRECGMTEAALAAETGLARSVVCRLASGACVPSLRTGLLVSAALGLPPLEMLSCDGPDTSAARPCGRIAGPSVDTQLHNYATT